MPDLDFARLLPIALLTTVWLDLLYDSPEIPFGRDS
jgi:hypothetical protein